MYQYVGRAAPFLVLASLGLFDGCKNHFVGCISSSICPSCLVLQLTVLKPGVSSEPIEGASIKVLIKDPYILLAAGNDQSRMFV